MTLTEQLPRLTPLGRRARAKKLPAKAGAKLGKE